MQVVFGWELDGPTFPETPDGTEFALDGVVVGPLGLLDILETRLGLNGPGTPAAVRIAQYLARLRFVDDGNQFYSGSRSADEWSTARLVLSWRDELVSNGWSPKAASWQSPRIDTLARVEAVKDLPLEPGMPDRVRSVTAKVKDGGMVQKLTLVDALEGLPLVWRELFDALAKAGTEIARADVQRRAANNDLARVQAVLTGEPSEPLSGDGSFCVVQTHDELVAANIAAEWLAAAPSENDDLVIVRQGDSTVFDAECRRLGLPRPGGSEKSPFRGALQVLPLAFETAWEPLDAARLLELLVIRGSPIPYRSGRYFADVLRDYPGSGGRRWADAWERAEEGLRNDLSLSDGTDTGIARRIDASLGEWRQWLEPRRFDRDTGIETNAADEVCRRVQRWALRRAAGTEDSAYRQAANAAAALADTIAASALETIPKSQLDRMIDAVVAEGISRPGTTGEAATWTVVDYPSQVWDRCHSVLWWGFSDPGQLLMRSPWSEAEQSELSAAGSAMVPAEDLLSLRLAAQRRALLNAGDRVLLAMPAVSAGAAHPTHPIWHELAKLEERNRAIVDGRRLRQAERILLAERQWQPHPVDTRTIPGSRRDWTVCGDLIGPRKTESATSLESLLGCPMKWVLEHHIGIRESVLLDMADDNRLKGNIAHDVLAHFFASAIPENEQGVRIAVETLLDSMLSEIGSLLLLPGRLRDREEVRRTTIESAVSLFHLLQENGLTVTATERRIESPLDDQTTLAGVVDLEVATSKGQPAIVDLKWSNSDRYRRAEIAEARPIQLATYARLINGDQETGLPPAAYFMMKQRRLLAVDVEPFPARFRVGGSDLNTIWQAIVITRQRLLDDLGQGRVVATGIPTNATVGEEPAEVDTTITVEPPCRFCSYGRLCGWRAVQ